MSRAKEAAQEVGADAFTYYRKRCLSWLHHDTGSIEYAVVAIGRRPEAPPDWALGACRQYAEIYDKSVQRQAEKPLGRYVDDGDTLSEIARRIIRDGLKFETAARAVLAKDADKDAIGRLRRVWKADRIVPNRWLQKAIRDHLEEVLEADLKKIAAHVLRRREVNASRLAAADPASGEARPVLHADDHD